MEKDIVPQNGYPLKLIRARGFEKGFSKETLEAVKGIFQSSLDAYKLIKEEKPDLVIGTGGFTSAMLLSIASLMGIPTMIHEQNAYPGRSNRLTGKLVKKVGISFPEAQQYFNEDKTFLAGNPIRDEFKTKDRKSSRETLGIKDNEDLIVFMGGSQGAGSINEAAKHVIENSKGKNRIFYLLVGKDQYQNIKRDLEENNLLTDNIKVFDYYNEMATLLFAADLIVSRSGAMSITEIAAAGVPSILIPYPKAAGDHQSYNARVITDNGGGIFIKDSELNGSLLAEKINYILDNKEVREKMREKTLEKKILDADERFCTEAYKIVNKVKEK